MEAVLDNLSADQLIVEQIREGAEDAPGDLVRTYHRIVRSLIRRYLDDEETADEIAQDVFVAAIQNIAQYRGTGTVCAWLLGIARKRVLEHFRKSARQPTPTTLDSVLNAVHVADLEDELDVETEERRLTALRSCLQSLKKPQRDLLVRFYYHGESAEDIATSVLKSAGTIRMTLFRLRKRLRICINKKCAQRAQQSSEVPT